HLLVRRDGEEPVGPVVPIDMPEFELDALFAQYDCRALHPRTGLEAHQKIFRHHVLAFSYAAISFLVSKFSSISTLFGSRRKICQRVLFGTWLTRCSMPLPARCFLVASKPRLPNATWSSTPDSGR